MRFWMLLLACGVPRGLGDDEHTGTILSVGSTPDLPHTEPRCDRQCPLAADDACEEFACYLYEVCCVSGSYAPPSGQLCAPGTVNACTAECGKQADCRVFVAPEDPQDEDYLDAVADYVDCISRC